MATAFLIWQPLPFASTYGNSRSHPFLIQLRSPVFTFLIWQPGAIAGIVVGSVVGAALIIGICVFLVKKNQGASDLPK